MTTACMVKGEKYDMFVRSIYEGVNIYTLFGIFFVGCVLGVLVEMLWCLFRYHKLESRKGLVWGPRIWRDCGKSGSIDFRNI